jgi:hypothetical protein
VIALKADVEKRLQELEKKNVYRVSSLADLVLLWAKRERGYPVPEIVEWDPEFKKLFDKCRR